MKSLLLLLATCLVLTSCNVVESTHMVGSKPYTEDRLGLAGRWMSTDGEKYALSFDKKEPGRIHLEPLTPAAEDDEEEEQFLYLRETNGWVFLNLLNDSEKGEPKTWLWALVQVADEKKPLLLYAPDPDQFAGFVRKDRIKGSVEETKAGKKKVVHPDGREETVHTYPSLVVTIDAPDAKWVEEMIAGKFGVPFEWRDPTVFLRIDKDGKFPATVPPQAAPSVPEDPEK